MKNKIETIITKAVAFIKLTVINNWSEPLRLDT
jgi:hypothetical protein